MLQCPRKKARGWVASLAGRAKESNQGSTKAQRAQVILALHERRPGAEKASHYRKLKKRKGGRCNLEATETFGLATIHVFEIVNGCREGAVARRPILRFEDYRKERDVN